MAHCGDQSLRTAIARERMHFHQLAYAARQKELEEAERVRAKAARRKHRALLAAWQRFVLSHRLPYAARQKELEEYARCLNELVHCFEDK